MALATADINYLAVLIVGIVGFAIGALWYSPVLFGTQWMKLMGFTKKTLESHKNTMFRSFGIGFLATLLMAFVLSYFVDFATATTFVEGLQVGLWVWAGFIVPLTLGSYLWESKPLKLFWINSLHWLVVLLVMSGILAVWV